MWVSFGGRVDVLVVSEGGRGTGWGAEMSSLWFRPSWPEPLEPRAWRRSIVVVFWRFYFWEYVVGMSCKKER
jgi:hypothetical protein